MKKLFFLILFLILSLTQATASVKDSTKYRKLNIRKYCISYKKGDTIPFSGIAYKNYFRGNRKRTIPFEYGIAEGKVTNYYRNNKKESEEIWKNGNIQSTIRYYKSGAKESTTEYANGSYLNSKTISYEESGLKKHEYSISNGNFNGVYKMYHTNGRLYALMLYDNGKKAGEWIYYDENGKVDYKEHYKNGKRDFYEYPQ